jgi:hypothetical protein
MNLSEQLARHLREIHFGGNWSWSNIKDNLTEITWEQAVSEVYSFNTIAALTYHMNYYLNTVYLALKQEPNFFKHEESFIHPQIQCEKDWKTLLEKTFEDAENFAKLIEQLPESKIQEDISTKYGTYYRNIQGVIEHNHYHLGQIVFIKKILATKNRT